MNTVCLLQIKTEGPGSGSSQKHPWLRGTLLREPWWGGTGRVRPFSSRAASAAPFVLQLRAGASGPAAAASQSVQQEMLQSVFQGRSVSHGCGC